MSYTSSKRYDFMADILPYQETETEFQSHLEKLLGD